MGDKSSINRYFLEIQNCFDNILSVKVFKFSKTVKFAHENLFIFEKSYILEVLISKNKNKFEE